MPPSRGGSPGRQSPHQQATATIPTLLPSPPLRLRAPAQRAVDPSPGPTRMLLLALVYDGGEICSVLIPRLHTVDFQPGVQSFCFWSTKVRILVRKNRSPFGLCIARDLTKTATQLCTSAHKQFSRATTSNVYTSKDGRCTHAQPPQFEKALADWCCAAAAESGSGAGTSP